MPGLRAAGGPNEVVESPVPVMADVGERNLERPTERRRPRTLLRPAVRVFAIACALLLTVTVLDSPTSRAADPDTDMDGLTDAYEIATLYTQRVTGSGLPKPIIDAGTETASTTLLPWQGIVNAAFADFTVDHPAKSELTVQVGYWDGTAWVDRYVWDPGSRLVGVSITQPVANQILEGTVTVTASVPAADTIDRVEFYLGTSLLGTVTTPSAANTFSVSFRALSYPFGGYQLKAVAIDKLGAAPSATIPVSIGDTAYPSVSFAAPLAGSYVAGTYKVKVLATDGNGVSSVRLRIDAGAYFSIYANFDGTYYWYNWGTTSVADGSHTLTAEATDGVGKVSTAAVSVTVDNSGGGGGGGGGCTRSPCPTSPSMARGSTGSAFGTASLGTASVQTSSGYTQSGTVSTVVADLTKPRSQVAQVDRDNRILPPEFNLSLFHSQLTWRIIVRDWVASPAGGGGGGGCPPICPTGIGTTSGRSSSVSAGLEGMSTTSTTQGSMNSFVLRIEERTDHTKADTDGDTLTDGAEVKTHLTYPTTVDTDGDGARDEFEVVSRTITYSVNGVATTRTVKTSPTLWDTDADGLPDGEEYTLGADRVVTNPVLADTDGDTLTDGAERLTYSTNATLTDTDKDTIADNIEVTPRTLVLTVNGVSQTRAVKTLPYAQDSDGDGLRDDQEFAGTSVYGVKTDPSDPDTDKDGLLDGQEKYVREFAMTTRKPIGSSITVPLAVTFSGSIERVDVRYGLSTIALSNFYVKLTKGTTTVVLRDRVGSGLYNYSSKDITTSFSSHGGTYSLYVSSPVTGGVLEEYALRFTLRTSPVKWDSDGDGLNDSEEVTYGNDAWITDPNRADTDGDVWSDGYEVNTKGTNPLSVDTDQDGANDSVDIDPLHNLLVAVNVKQIHHGAGPWCTPELLGVVRVNNDYAWVTQHVNANLESFTSWACPPLIPTTQYSTSSFYFTYYADVPDQTSSASLRMTAWSINPGRGDDILVDQSVTYALNSGTKSFSLTNGNSWVTFDAWTYALPKAKTLLVTDGNATVAASNGQSRLDGQDRYFVFTLDVTSSYSPFLFGVNAIVVPRAIFVDSKLKRDFDASNYWPLADATLYGQDLGKADVSEGVAGVIAKALSGADAYNVLDRLLRNAANVKVYSYVDITSYAVLANLPADVVRILPWAGVSNGPTGAMPADFWQKIGAVAATVVNSLVYVGQLIYKGLVALGTFLVDLGTAIVDWGMKALGAVSQAVAGAVNAVASALNKLLEAIIYAVSSAIRALLDTLVQPIVQMIEQFKRAIFDAIGSLTIATTADAFVTAMGAALFGSQLFFVIMLLTVGISVAEKITMVGSGGFGAILMNTLMPIVRDMLIVTIVSLAVIKIFNSVLPAPDQISNLVPAQFEVVGKLSFGAAKFLEKFGLYYAAETRGFKSLPAIERMFSSAIVSLVILFVGMALPQILPPIPAQVGKVLLDLVTVWYALQITMPTLGKAKGPLSRFYPLMFPVGEALSLVAAFSATATLISDVFVLGDLTGKW